MKACEMFFFSLRVVKKQQQQKKQLMDKLYKPTTTTTAAAAAQKAITPAFAHDCGSTISTYRSDSDAFEGCNTEIGFIVCACGAFSLSVNQAEGNMLLNNAQRSSCMGH